MDVNSSPGDHLRYDHFQIYADSLEPLATYKALEKNLDALTDGLEALDDTATPADARGVWRSIAGADAASVEFSPSLTSMAMVAPTCLARFSRYLLTSVMTMWRAPMWRQTGPRKREGRV